MTTPEPASESNPSSSTPPPADPPRAIAPVPPAVGQTNVDSVVIGPDPVIDEARLRSLTDPFSAMPAVRLSAREFIQPDTPADATLVRQFVTVQRQRELWSQLEALQEEVIANVRADRRTTDAYQQDLLYANSLLLQSPANFEEARQIVYRVRADLQRERRVLADVRRYRPRLTIYYLIWFVVTILAFSLDPYFRQLMPDGLPVLKLAWLPILFGVLGALFNGIMALNEHTSVRFDFDPVHMTWYLLNPLMGGLLGLVVFVFFVVAGSSFTPTLATDPRMSDAQAPLVIWLLAFVVGWQQNILFQLLNRFLKTVVPRDNSAVAERPTQRPPAPPASGD